MSGSASARSVHVLVIPYPAQGHLLPFLDLIHLLSSRYGLDVTVAVTPANSHLLSPLLALSPSVEPLVLPFPDYPSLPPGRENTKDLAPHQFHFLAHALGGLHEALFRWARARPRPPTAIVSDMFVGWTSRLAGDLGIPRIVFNCSGAASVAVLSSVFRQLPLQSNPHDPNELVDFPSLPNSPTYRWYQLPGIFRSYVRGEPAWEFIRESWLNNLSSWGHVFNTFSEIEQVHLDHIKEDLGHSRIWAVGPLALQVGGTAAERGGSSSLSFGELTAWLDGHEERSAVYVSFGTQKVLSPEQAAVVAAALERSGSKFVWSARAMKHGYVFLAVISVSGESGTPVPEGFEERVADMGLVIRDWAPQVAILNHAAVGVFLSHCGWNSVLKAAAAGVVLLMWPMGAEQFVNARLLMEEDVGMGVMACDGVTDAAPDPDELARLLAESVGETAKERRKKTLKVKDMTAQVVKEGGSSYGNLDSMVEELQKHAAIVEN